MRVAFDRQTRPLYVHVYSVTTQGIICIDLGFSRNIGSDIQSTIYDSRGNMRYRYSTSYDNSGKKEYLKYPDDYYRDNTHTAFCTKEYE